jgi:sugar O-acyltransferase (sialic acid O-acetyltransferase NeuD family)
MKNLLIIGARGFGRKVFSLAETSIGYNKDFIIKGFLDDYTIALDDFDNYPEIVSSVEDYIVQDNDVFVCALGDVVWKKKYIEMILKKGGKFTNLIHPSCIINTNVQLGVGNIFFNGVTICNDSIINNFISIQSNTVVGHDTKIEDFCHINSFSFTGGYSIIHNEVTLHTRATVLPRIQVYQKSIVGAGAVVNKNVLEGTTVVGVPAKPIKE